MLILDILQIPLEFIKEHLTGWVILILAVFIIYFICLRKYYIQREKFLDASVELAKLEDIESAEDDINQSSGSAESSQSSQSKQLDNDKAKAREQDMRNSLREYKKERKVLKNSDEVNYQFNQNNYISRKSASKSAKSAKSTKSLATETTSTIKKANLEEGFEDITISPTGGISAASRMPPIATTIFDNLNLNTSQIQECLANYNKVIAQLIIDIGNLADLSSRNRYLNLKKQFDTTLARGVDNIITHLTMTIKSPRILTRTAIRTEVISTINNTLENLINKTNQDLSTAMNALAMMNSTTVDYNSQLAEINESRASLEKYIAIDKMLNELGHNENVSQKEVSSILDKSFILPIYERNFDKISQLAKSDFNDNEGAMAMKYSKAYMDFLEQQKKEELNINPLSLASQIESGIIGLLTNLGDSSSTKARKVSEIKTAADIPASDNYGDNWYVGNTAVGGLELREQLTRDYGFTGTDNARAQNNPIPKNNISSVGNNIELNKANIYRDSGNRGTYMINSKAQGDILEGFADTTIPATSTSSTPATSKPSTTSPSLIKAFDDGNKYKDVKKNQDSGADITSKLLSGDFLQYMLDTINTYMTGGYDMYKNIYNDKINTYLEGITGSRASDFKLENNMIPAGFALFILSMLLYFVDITSSTSD
jgi:hypothetical protein